MWKTTCPRSDTARLSGPPASRTVRHCGPTAGADTVDITVAGTSESVRLLAAALDVIRAVLANMAAGQGVTVVPAHAELTTSRTLGC